MKNTKIVLLALIIFVSSFLPVLYSESSKELQKHWEIEFVDNEGDTMRYTSLALDSNDQPHISYLGNENTLRYAHWTGNEWEIEVVDSSEYAIVGKYTSLALDSNNYPHISYYYDTHLSLEKDYLKYAYWTGTEWRTEVVDSGKRVGEYTSLALDSEGNPHISYYDAENSSLKYARWTGDGWDIEVVDNEGDTGKYTSLALDSNNYPHISYYSGNSLGVYVWESTLKYAHWTGSEWEIEMVDDRAGFHTSLALDDGDRPHIVYYDWDDEAIKYAEKTDDNWTIELVNSEMCTDDRISLAMDSKGYPHISYFDEVHCCLKYAKRTETGWFVEDVDTKPCSGDSNSLALDSNDLPHISYEGSWKLKYAKAVPDSVEAKFAFPDFVFLLGIAISGGIIGTAVLILKRRKRQSTG